MVSSVRDDDSQLWEMKGRDVSIVRVVESSAMDEIGQRRDGVRDKAKVKGLRRLESEEEEEQEVRRDKAISDQPWDGDGDGGREGGGGVVKEGWGRHGWMGKN
ncbi:pyruvate dehydrogenase E1 component subunit alpha [Pyrus ussuriensis x Pyrus communis]|uniref:Pyruvate dehydrogenase E1 component subunit alpha n=1 Tax=Pyrus ussuriensis x Pyrus communis TaxID=2448454 RepID=A0A5N5HX39_9ROSA|nr:pyruvate dehydrogenase E1 component subunit alpha [Pyrus ussuriensis x Pyrus communis]